MYIIIQKLITSYPQLCYQQFSFNAVNRSVILLGISQEKWRNTLINKELKNIQIMRFSAGCQWITLACGYRIAACFTKNNKSYGQETWL